MNYLWILTLGSIGVSLRFAADRVLHLDSFPLATFIVNLLGCFLAGYFFTQETSALRSGLLIGLCGSLTTFSALILQVLVMLRGEEYLKAFGYLFVSQVIGLILAWLGTRVGRTYPLSF